MKQVALNLWMANCLQQITVPVSEEVARETLAQFTNGKYVEEPITFVHINGTSLSVRGDQLLAVGISPLPGLVQDLQLAPNTLQPRRN